MSSAQMVAILSRLQFKRQQYITSTNAMNASPVDGRIYMHRHAGLSLITCGRQSLATWKGALQWRHNERDGVSNHQTHDCLLNRLFRLRSKKTSQLSVTGLCAGNSSVTGEFPAQRSSNAGNVSIWLCHHGLKTSLVFGGFLSVSERLDKNIFQTTVDQNDCHGEHTHLLLGVCFTLISNNILHKFFRH